MMSPLQFNTRDQEQSELYTNRSTRTLQQVENTLDHLRLVTVLPC